MMKMNQYCKDCEKQKVFSKKELFEELISDLDRLLSKAEHFDYFSATSLIKNLKKLGLEWGLDGVKSGGFEIDSP